MPGAASEYCRGRGKESQSQDSYQLVLPLDRVPTREIRLLGSTSGKPALIKHYFLQNVGIFRLRTVNSMLQKKVQK